MDTPTQVPKTLVAGDSWSWTRSLPDYPASTWTLKYNFASREKDFSVTAIASGDDHSVTIAKATTAPYNAGLYQWAATVTDGVARYTIERGQVQVLPNPESLGAGNDPRSHCQRMVEAATAALENRASTEQRELLQYSIGDRQATFDSQDTRSKLVELRNFYLWQLENEKFRDRAASGAANPRFVQVRSGG